MDILSLAEELAEEFGARAGEVDREGRFPFENIERMKETGYLKICVPEELGGLGGDLPTTAKAQGIIAKGCASTALCSNMHIFGIGAAAEGWYDGERAGSPVFGLVANGAVVGGSLTDAATGLNVRTSSTPARKVDGGYVISGRKSFCSLAPVLDFFWGTAAEPGGPLLLFGLPRDTPGLKFVDTWDTMAMRGTGSWDVVFEDVFVPDIAVVGGGQGNTQGGAAGGAVWTPATERPFAWFSFTIASIYLGVARAAAEFAYDYVGNRTVTGASAPMSHQPAQIFSAAEIELLLRPAEALVEDGLRRRAAGETLSATQLNTIKYVAVNNAAEATDRCLRMVGGHGLFRKLPLERYYRDVRAGQFHPPSNDVALETIGRAVLGIRPDLEPRWPAD